MCNLVLTKRMTIESLLGGGSPLDNKTCCDTISGQHVDMKYGTIECCTPWVLPTKVLFCNCLQEIYTWTSRPESTY